jgi:hypothetical protein
MELGTGEAKGQEVGARKIRNNMEFPNIIDEIFIDIILEGRGRVERGRDGRVGAATAPVTREGQDLGAEMSTAHTQDYNTHTL